MRSTGIAAAAAAAAVGVAAAVVAAKPLSVEVDAAAAAAWGALVAEWKVSAVGGKEQLLVSPRGPFLSPF